MFYLEIPFHMIILILKGKCYILALLTNWVKEIHSFISAIYPFTFSTWKYIFLIERPKSNIKSGI